MQIYYHNKKIEKIDLHADYPCPCCRRGRLSLITLTEALGCERCQEIFVVHEDGYLLEGLKTAYPYPRKWYWADGRWTAQSASPKWSNRFFSSTRFTLVALVFAILVILVSIIVSMLPTLSYGWLALILGIVVGFAIVLWNMF